jgi:hypothetical protein
MNMKLRGRIRLMSVLLPVVAAGLVHGQGSAAAALDAASEWKSLFDGKSLNGWEAHGDAEDWRVENGALVCGGTVAGWLGTTDTFSDFVLRLEFRGAARVNSGVFLRSEKQGQPHVTGYELQIWDYQPAGYNTGSLVNSLKAQPAQILADEWNKYEIHAEGDHFVVTLNGKTLLDGRDSKHSSGVIGLQCMPKNPISFRNLSIRALKSR